MKSWNKIVLFSLLLSIGIFSSSCSDDKDPVPSPGNTSGEMYLSFRLNTDPAGVFTRATTDDGTPEERKVSKVYMLLYESGGSSAKLLSQREINATNGDGSVTFSGTDVVAGLAPTQSRFVAKAIQLKKGEYQMIILINPNTDILSKAVENVSTVGDMQEIISNVSPDNYMNNGFFMTNAGGVIQILSNQLKDSEAAAENEPVSAPVERLLAKILVFESRTKALTEVTTGGTIENVSWGLDILNKQTYLLRMQDQLKGGGASESGFHSDRSSVYAKDPNFTGNKNIVSDNTEKDKNFTILDPLATTGFKPWNTYADKDLPLAKEYQYILENTVSAADQNATDVDPLSYMTHVILKLTIKNPGKAPNVITEADYYSFSYRDGTTLEWRAFTHAQAVEWYNGTYPSDIPADLYKAMKEADEDVTSSFQFEIVSGVSPSAPATYISTKTSFGQLTFHKAGLNIYRIPIMHFGTDSDVTDETDYGYYGVVRNNTYKLIINSINGPGINTSNEGFISADITVNPWFERTWGEDLEPERVF